MPFDLGPLPQSDDKAEIQRRSFDALRYILPSDIFVCRDERIEDAGVDLSLEILIEGRYTNFRSQIQLKGRTSVTEIANGSISLQIETSNLNYLLNGPSPLYVLYIVLRDEFRYLWAQDERDRLVAVNSNWTTQESVNIHFEKRLTSDAISEIHERILREGKLRRDISDLLGRAGSSENIVTSINPETLTITDPDELNRILSGSGLAMVASGYADQVRNSINLLKMTDVKKPRIHLVRAYAEYVLGRYLAALGCIAEAVAQSDMLLVEDRRFVKVLQKGCEYQLGRLSVSEYNLFLENEVFNQTDRFALSHRLNRAWIAMFDEQNQQLRPQKIKELRSVTTEILAKQDAGISLKVHARLRLLEAEAWQFSLNSIEEMLHLKMCQSAGITPRSPHFFGVGKRWLELWEQRFDSVMEKANQSGNPILIADGLVVKATFDVQVVTLSRAFSLQFEIPFQSPKEFLQVAWTKAEKATEIYSKANQLEGVLRAKATCAEILMIGGNIAESLKIVEAALPQAEAMGYVRTADRLRDCLNGTLLYNQLQAIFTKPPNYDPDPERASSSDELLQQTAESFVRALRLPKERIPIVFREHLSHRDAARERLNWCDNLELLQDLQHKRSPLTYFKVDPDRVAFCRKHKFHSIFGNPDWQAVILAFKQAYCSSCADRRPKHDNSDGANTL